MSSILDALKKLEAEKAARQTVEQEEDLQFHPETAAGELTGAPEPHSPVTALHLSPMAMIIGGAIFAVLLIAISVTASIVVARISVSYTVVSGNNPAALTPVASATPAEAAPPARESVPAAPPSSPEPTPAAATPDTPAPAAPQPPPTDAAPAPEAPAPTPTMPPAITPPIHETTEDGEGEKIPIAQSAEPPSEPPNTESVDLAAPPVQTAPAIPSTAPASPPAYIPPVIPSAVPPTPPPVTPKPAPDVKPAVVRRTPGPVDLESLPILRSSERVRYGLENLRLNVLREAGPNRPSGLAIINLNKVYIGEMIPGTRARLIEVKSHGIGIEIADTGEQFYVPH